MTNDHLLGIARVAFSFAFRSKFVSKNCRENCHSTSSSVAFIDGIVEDHRTDKGNSRDEGWRSRRGVRKLLAPWRPLARETRLLQCPRKCPRTQSRKNRMAETLFHETKTKHRYRVHGHALDNYRRKYCTLYRHSAFVRGVSFDEHSRDTWDRCHEWIERKEIEKRAEWDWLIW